MKTLLYIIASSFIWTSSFAFASTVVPYHVKESGVATCTNLSPGQLCTLDTEHGSLSFDKTNNILTIASIGASIFISVDGSASNHCFSFTYVNDQPNYTKEPVSFCDSPSHQYFESEYIANLNGENIVFEHFKLTDNFPGYPTSTISITGLTLAPSS